jgi:hypothetical protein
MILTPERKYDVGEGFGFSPVSYHSGLLTYRYLKLFTGLDTDLYNSEALANLSNLRSIFQAKTFVNQIIRNENLETDLILSLENSGIGITEEQRARIHAGKTQKTNTSARKGVEYY